MDFTYAELARLNQMIGIAMRSGKIKFDEISESVHKKVADEIIKLSGCTDAKLEKAEEHFVKMRLPDEA